MQIVADAETAADGRSVTSAHLSSRLQNCRLRAPEEADADRCTRQVQESLDDVASALIADPEPTMAHQPSQAPLHDPRVLTQALLRFDAAPGDTRRDTLARRARRLSDESYASSACSLAGRKRGRPGRPRGPTIGGMASISGSKSFESWTLAPESRTASGTPLRSTTRWYLLPRLPRSTGFGPVCSPPRLARTLRLSRLARDQSIPASSPSQFNSVPWRRRQTPAACQSRRRRQHVEPLPQPSSRGSSRHGTPVRRTNTMPLRAARSGMRGRPLLGLGRSLGRSGSIASQSSSDTSARDIMGEHHAARSVFCNML